MHIQQKETNKFFGQLNITSCKSDIYIEKVVTLNSLIIIERALENILFNFSFNAWLVVYKNTFKYILNFLILITEDKNILTNEYFLNISVLFMK